MNKVIPSEVEESRCDRLKIISRDPSTLKAFVARDDN
jgi:hypothetical protein